MKEPQRIQRKRTKGWRMPPDAVYVGRPTKYGNPYTVHEFLWSATEAVGNYRLWIEARPELVKQAREELKGKDLACWCPLDGQPCHADVLLEIANEGSEE